ncbi:Rhodanese-like domain-containing protein [Irpex rosettiformis]|uniref:Rhodanese-like domain-containing protein n=1 Tax=Irpex rosettiformis TaxID=378272 RepID=A0ACB8TQE1_9APHY|nr:Rhodanese-like domain-containing protein [Irpex rosettiformis]
MSEYPTPQQWIEKTPDWARSLPQPKSNPPHISIAEVAELIRTKKPSVDFIVVDLRRADWDTNYIRTAINLPAHSLYQSLPSLLPLLQSIPLVIFHCQSCSPVSRGSRAASWYQDALNEAGITTSQARILTGGIKAWVAEYGDDESLTVKIPSP